MVPSTQSDLADRQHSAPSVSHATNATCTFTGSVPVVSDIHDATLDRTQSSGSGLAFAATAPSPRNESRSRLDFASNSPILTIRPNSLRCRKFSLLADAAQLGLDIQPTTLDRNGTRSNPRHPRLGTILQLPPQMQKNSDFAGVISELFYTRKC